MATYHFVHTRLALQRGRPWVIAHFAVAVAVGAVPTGCAVPPEARTVATQAESTTGALDANVHLLAGATRELAALQAAAVLRLARERIAADLTRLRVTITPDTPTDADLANPAAPWSVALAAEVGALRDRLSAAPLDTRAAAAASVEDAHPATIDLAAQVPGFTPPRVLRDAAALDALNAAVESEPDPALRAALLARRDALLDAYAPARTALALTSTLTRAANELARTTAEQSATAHTQSTALATWTRAGAAPAPLAAAANVYHDPALRESILDLVSRTNGPAAAAKLRDHLTRADAALATLRTP